MGAKILHFKDTSVPILLIVGRFIQLTLRLRWGQLRHNIVVVTCFKGFVVTWALGAAHMLSSHFTLFSLGPASSCQEHWHQHSCSALLAHSPQSVKRARAVFPPCSALIMDNSSQSSAQSWGSLTWSPGSQQETELRPGALCLWPLTQQRQKQRVQLRERGMSSWSSENANGSSYRWSDPESPTRRLGAGPELGWWVSLGCRDQAHPGPWPLSEPGLGSFSQSSVPLPDTSHQGWLRLN